MTTTVAHPPHARPVPHPHDGMESAAHLIAYRRAAGSVGMAHVRLLAGVIQAAWLIAREFGDRHPDGCGCDFCAVKGCGPEWTRADVAGLAWQLEHAASLLLSIVPEQIDLQSDEFPMMLNQLIQEADALDMLNEAEEADAPAFVN